MQNSAIGKFLCDLLAVYTEHKQYNKITEIYFTYKAFIETSDHIMYSIFDALIYTNHYEEAFVIYQKHDFIVLIDVLDIIEHIEPIGSMGSKQLLELYLLENDKDARYCDRISPASHNIFMERRKYSVKILDDIGIIDDLIDLIMSY